MTTLTTCLVVVIAILILINLFQWSIRDKKSCVQLKDMKFESDVPLPEKPSLYDLDQDGLQSIFEIIEEHFNLSTTFIRLNIYRAFANFIVEFRSGENIVSEQLSFDLVNQFAKNKFGVSVIDGTSIEASVCELAKEIIRKHYAINKPKTEIPTQIPDLQPSPESCNT